MSTSPEGSGWRAWLPVAYQALPVCRPSSSSENVKLRAASAWAFQDAKDAWQGTLRHGGLSGKVVDLDAARAAIALSAG
jgi:hypothetical protein